jgi:tetratricopeptide (TPR) repeat protein
LVEILYRKGHLTPLPPQNGQSRVEQNKELTKAAANAVIALGQQRGKPDAPSGIEEALAQLSQKNTQAAETIFETVLERKAAEGKAANQEAAEAARHIGALAFLHDTEKALAAYRRAVELDPANAEGWNQLGHLLSLVGHLDEAADAYNHVRALGTTGSDPTWLAVAYGNLGHVYHGREDLAQAEAMYRTALVLVAPLGYKRDMAGAYNRLGQVLQRQGDLAQAEVMYGTALAFDKALDRKEGMVDEYFGLGLVYWARGNLTQAESMFNSALTLSQDIGATPFVEKIRAALDELRGQGAP